jgi:hypothetical protein
MTRTPIERLLHFASHIRLDRKLSNIETMQNRVGNDVSEVLPIVYLARPRGNCVDDLRSAYELYRPDADRTWRTQCAPTRATVAWSEFRQDFYEFAAACQAHM